MSCRDARAWRAALAHRFSADAEPPATWPAAVEHLAGCARCRELALAVDPTLVFTRLADAPPVAVDVEAMRQAVAGLRRASAVAESERGRGRSLPAVRSRWGRYAAAALLAAALGAQLPALRSASSTVVARGAGPDAADTLVGASLRSAAGIPRRGSVSSLGSPGFVGRPAARVYEIADRDMSVIMVVDHSLDL